MWPMHPSRTSTDLPVYADRLAPSTAREQLGHADLYGHVPLVENTPPSAERTLRERTAERDAARRQRDDLQDDLQQAHDRNDFLHRMITAAEAQRDRLQERYEAELARQRIDPDAIAPWLRRALNDPGAIAGVRRGPTWPAGHEGWAEQQESITDWTIRALHRVIAAGGRPHCEKCSQPIRLDDAYEPPLPGVGLWEHVGTCPTRTEQTA